MPLPAPAASIAHQRLHALDAVRGGALTLGVVLHATLSFMPGPQMWLVVDPSRSNALALLFFVIHLFRMTLFFLLAGFFAHLLLERLGTVAFIKDRLRRIALPLVIFWPLVFTGFILVLVWLAHIQSGGLPRNPPAGPRFTPDDFPLTHLWFLWVLLLFYAATLAVRAVLIRVGAHALSCRLADRALRVLARPAGVLLLALPTALILFLEPKWSFWSGIRTPDKTLYANLPAWVAHGSAFVVGGLLARQQPLLAMLREQWASYVALAAAVLTLCIAYIIGGRSATPLAMDPTRLLITMIYASGAWSVSFAAIALALRFLDDWSPARRYLADASYWIYIVHLPLVLALQVVASQLPWAWWIKFPLIVAVAFLLMLASYHWLVRGRAIGALLGGPRIPLRRPAPARRSESCAEAQIHKRSP